jgi:signal transduction histidine kinase
MLNAIANEVVVASKRALLLGMADDQLSQRLAYELVSHARSSPISIVPSLEQLRETAKENSPAVILLDDEFLAAKPLSESLRSFTAIAPVIFFGSAESYSEVTRLIADGHLEFVARAGDFVPLALSLVERRLRWLDTSESTIGPPWAEFSADIGEIFRHEINNPLTGILGNAELLLAHRDHFSAMEIQRLQTVVDLAVRMRETIRRVSNAWDRQGTPLNSRDTQPVR